MFFPVELCHFCHFLYVYLGVQILLHRLPKVSRGDT